ncbi:hypothetical protein [Salinivibrio sp. MA607]|uniref:hypothetical protein n=1 Tax=Salinivibrio sp. MA607 TaxID=1909457 RepID=UPI0009899E5E|nr:hypothetical protein [Salinivibrio sp. MA607]OOF07240.1 hypothetical protein BZG81_00620 [Salinivibrio sp. MA607]
MKLNLLIVEDVEQLVGSWKEKLDFYSVEGHPTYSITPYFVTNLSEAEKALENSKFDAAVIDIRLDEKGQQTYNGNEVLAKLSHNSLTVCAVYTGEPGSEVIEDHLKDFIRVFDKGDGEGIERILKWLDEKADMISAIQTMQSSFNRTMAHAFTRSIWPRWSYWLENDGPIETEKALTRHMATHLHASYLSNEGLGAHPEEYFFIPPLQEHLDTGDIIYQGGKFEIIITPRCDILRRKSETSTYQLITLLDRSEEWNALKEKLANKRENGTPNQIKKASNELKKFTNHNGETGGHFIQSFRVNINGEEKNFGPFYAQFNMLHSIERSDENKQELLETRIASLSNEFVPSLVERLGAYFSRIGTPDYSHPE